MAGLHLSTEDDELVLDEGVTEESSVAVDLCLVGRFLTDQTINFNLMRSRMASIWRPGKGVFVKDIGQGRFIFQFFHVVDLQRIVEGGPWSFGNIPLILHRLKSGEFPLHVPLDTLAFWIQIHDLPAGYLTEGIGRLLGNFIGAFLEYDSTNSSGVWRQYMRIRVGVKVTEPLKRFKRIKKRDGTSFVVKFKYERLHIFCFICGRLGHSESFCDSLFNRDGSDIAREWGAWLKAADRRTGSLSGDKWLRTDDGPGANGDRNPIPEPGVNRPGKEPFQFGSNGNGAENQRQSYVRISCNKSWSNSIPQSSRMALQEIQIPGNSIIPIQDVSYNDTPFEERKRRRENVEGGKSATNSSDVLLLGSTEDDKDEAHFLSAGSGLGTGRAQ